MKPGFRGRASRLNDIIMKKLLYFRHDYNARKDPKLQDVLIEHGVAGIGVFWCIVEMLYEQEGTLPLRSCKSIAFALHVDCKVVESIVNDFSLFENDGENFWSNAIKRRIAVSYSIAAKRKEAALSRWKSEPTMQSNANAEQSECKSTVNINRNININKEISSKEDTKKSAQRFSPPSLSEVQAYIKEKGYAIDAEAFIAFYESKGWYVGKNKMKNWRMAVVTWSKRNNSGTSQPRQTRSATTRICNDEWK